MKGTYLGEFQEIVLLSVLVLGENAYGVSIQEDCVISGASDSCWKGYTPKVGVGTPQSFQDSFFLYDFFDVQPL